MKENKNKIQDSS